MAPLRVSLLAVCAWTLAAIFPAGLLAQQTSSDRAYEASVSEALSDLKAGRFEEARASFLRAHELKPSARTQRGLGVVALELHHYAEAERWLRRALRDPRRPLTERQRVEAEQALARLHGLVGRYTLSVDPSSADVRIDGTPLARDEEELGLDIGSHTLTVEAPRHRPYRRTLEVHGGEHERLDIVLEVVPSTPAPVAVAPVKSRVPSPIFPPEPPDPKRQDRRWGWATLGVSAGLLVTGTTLLAVGLRDVSRVENAPDGTPWSELEAARDRAPVLTSLGAVSIGLGLGGAALGLWFLQRTELPRARSVDIGLSPFGVLLRGRI